jgi:hypothetical protein
MSLYLLIGVGAEYLLEGIEHRMYELVREAFDIARNAEELRPHERFGGAEFPAAGVVRVFVDTSKTKFMGDGWRSYRPRSFVIPYGEGTRAGDVIREIIAGGGDRPWTDAELAETDNETA